MHVLSIDTCSIRMAHLVKLYTMLPYTFNYNKLPALFTSLYTSPVPEKLTYRFLASLGFKSSKERDLFKFLHSFGFITISGIPTATYSAFKQAPSPEAFVSSCAKQVYKELLTASIDFSSPSQLANLIQSLQPDISKQPLDLICATFSSLNAYASFIPERNEKNSLERATKRPINININLPETDNEAIYGMIFRHLKDILGG